MLCGHFNLIVNTKSAQSKGILYTRYQHVLLLLFQSIQRSTAITRSRRSKSINNRIIAS